MKQKDLAKFLLDERNLRRMPYRPGRDALGIEKVMDEILGFTRGNAPITRGPKRARRAPMPPAASGAAMGWMDLIQMLMPQNKRGNYTSRWNDFLYSKLRPDLDA